MGKQLRRTTNNQMQNCKILRPRIRSLPSGDNTQYPTLPVRTRSPTTLQLQKNGLEGLRAKASKLSTTLESLWNSHSRNSEPTGERHKHSHKASNTGDHTPS